MATKEVAIRKRQMISKANRNMFIAVALASMVLGFAIVGSVFLIKKGVFNNKVIIEKQKTVKTLKASNANYPELETNIKNMRLNKELETLFRDILTGDEDEDILRIIPNSLPSVSNYAALGASISDRLLDINDITIQSVRIGRGGSSSIGSSTQSTGLAKPIEYHFSVYGPITATREVMENLEKSIRIIDVSKMTLTYSRTDRLTLDVTGNAYYVDPAIAELGEKEVKP